MRTFPRSSAIPSCLPQNRSLVPKRLGTAVLGTGQDSTSGPCQSGIAQPLAVASTSEWSQGDGLPHASPPPPPPGTPSHTPEDGGPAPLCEASVEQRPPQQPCMGRERHICHLPSQIGGPCYCSMASPVLINTGASLIPWLLPLCPLCLSLSPWTPPLYSRLLRR